ncbi:prepilin-type N-terminal cleavage/methylation domain-containing protein [Bacillus kwashiorkori]|uniref:prepilin-type N-terminal cleavage/methylation domain-containing protein n=1 Tax=Bacillus kwashiorkori TaxID=1522318 RepID=UPI0007824C6B|nr:prepilin-type N-terminal cleavage/methylation domain-containing protein [Bacillus kwashiorkori]
MRKHLKHLKNEKGMTLIELLAVIVILAIIAAVAIPIIGNVIGDSRDKADVTEALNIISAAKLRHAQDPVEGTGDNFSYSNDELAGYIGNTSGFTSVDFDSTNWSIKGHDAITVLDKEKDTDSVTEGELQEFLNGEDN